MRFAILSASGRLGGKTLQAVLDRGVPAADVVALARKPSKLDSWAAQGVELRRADYGDRELLEAAFQGIDRLLLVPSTSMPVPRIIEYDNAISAARAAGVKRLLHYGIIGAHVENPFTIMPFLLYAESALRTSGLEWTILRNSFYADPIADWTPDIITMGAIPYPTGDGRCAYVSRDDIARAGAAALTGDGHADKVYNLTGPEALSTADLCNIVSRVTGKPVGDRGASDEDYIKACRNDGVPEPFIHILLTIYWGIRDGMFDIVSDDIERLTSRPAARFEDYLRSRL